MKNSAGFLMLVENGVVGLLHLADISYQGNVKNDSFSNSDKAGFEEE